MPPNFFPADYGWGYEFKRSSSPGLVADPNCGGLGGDCLWRLDLKI